MRSRLAGNKFKRQVGLAASAAVVYKVWLNRNQAVWNQVVNTISHTVNEMKYIMKNRIVQILNTKVADNDRRWIENL